MFRWSFQGEELMQEIISRVAAAAGIGEDVAKQAVSQILAFVQKEGPAGPVAEMMSKIPGASDLAAEAGGGGGGGMMGAIGGLMGGGGIMGLAGKLTGMGLGMGEMQSVGKEIFAYAREKAGEDVVGQVAGGIPGLSQFV
jgi:hypothetical protein